MYFTSNSSGTMMFDKTNKIYSAISEDGVNYTFERVYVLNLKMFPHMTQQPGILRDFGI